jgi:hypothetical protein
VERLQYLDFELKIEREGENFSAIVLNSPEGEASATFALPFSQDKLENLILRLGHSRGITRRFHSNELEAARELGGELFKAVFRDEVRDCLRASLAKIDPQKGTGLRLKFRLQDVPELADIPWEFLYDQSFNTFLAQSIETPIVRYIEISHKIQPLTITLPLQVLVMISSPNDPNYPRLDIERERALLEKALHSLIEEGKVHLHWLEKATFADLERCLRKGKYHVFHFIGHGGFDKRTEEGFLVLEDAQGRGWLAGAHRISTLLHDYRSSLRLVVLNSCEGARNSRTDPFAGIAASLVRQDIPAVVAMQYEITDHSAIVFADDFYTALADAFPVDAAVAVARRAIYFQPNDVEWGTPVLYTRAPDGVLFDVADEHKSPVQSPAVSRETEPIKKETPPIASLVSYLASSKRRRLTSLDIRKEREFKIDISLQELQDRMGRWASAHEFKCISESPRRWVFHRGNKWNVLFNFDFRKIPTEVVILISGEKPNTVSCSMHCKNQFFLSTKSDHRLVSKELDTLLAYLVSSNVD